MVVVWCAIPTQSLSNKFTESILIGIEYQGQGCHDKWIDKACISVTKITATTIIILYLLIIQLLSITHFFLFSGVLSNQNQV